MTPSPDARLENFAATHHGVFTRAEALTLGVTDRMIEGRARIGRWERVLPSVYRVVAVAPSCRQRAMAAALWSRGLVSYIAAARLWLLEGVTGSEMHVTVDRNRGLRHERIAIHRTDDLIPQIVH